MPTYEYKCNHCGHIFDVRHSMNDEPIVNCPHCGSESKRIITGGSGFILKATGKSSISNSQGTKCGKEKTCCGKETPCEIRPCDK
jgi:putative FmdB family regulatory protein